MANFNEEFDAFCAHVTRLAGSSEEEAARLGIMLKHLNRVLGLEPLREEGQTYIEYCASIALHAALGHNDAVDALIGMRDDLLVSVAVREGMKQWEAGDVFGI